MRSYDATAAIRQLFPIIFRQFPQNPTMDNSAILMIVFRQATVDVGRMSAETISPASEAGTAVGERGEWAQLVSEIVRKQVAARGEAGAGGFPY